MMKYIFSVTFLFLVMTSSFSQKGTFLGFEAALNHDIYEFNDPCNLFSSVPLSTGSWGFTLGQELNKNLGIESGFIVKYYDAGYRFASDVPGFGVKTLIWSAYSALQIPLRIKGRAKLIKNKLYLTGTLGYHFAINSDYNPGVVSEGKGTHAIGDDTVKTSLVTRELRKTFSLIEVGLGLDLLSGPNLVISLSSSYYLGLNPVYQLEFETEGNICNPDQVTGLSKGTYWNVAIGIKYRISHFWTKKSYNIPK